MKKKIRLNPDDIDYKNLPLLRRYLADNGKIISSAFTELDSRTQRAVAREIKRARQLALLPYVDYKHRKA